MDAYSRAVGLLKKKNETLDEMLRELGNLIAEYKTMMIAARPEGSGFAAVDAPFEFTETPGQYVPVSRLTESELQFRSDEAELARKFGEMAVSQLKEEPTTTE